MTKSIPDEQIYNAGIAEAFGEMEDAICDLRNAELLCELALQSVQDESFSCEPAEIKSTAHEISKRVFVVSDDDFSTLTYAVHHVSALIEALFQSYHADSARSREEALKAGP